MAKKKTARKRKRKSSGTLSAKVRRRATAHAPAKRRKRKKGFMSEVFTPNNAMEAGKSTLSGGIGGGGSYMIDAMGAGEIKNELGRGAIHLGLSFIVGAVLGMKNVGAGMSGAWMYSTIERLRGQAMHEDFDGAEFTDEEILNKYPDGMDENGTPMYLADDGKMYYLEELSAMADEYNLANGGYQLAQNGQARLYPGYVQTF